MSNYNNDDLLKPLDTVYPQNNLNKSNSLDIFSSKLNNITKLMPKFPQNNLEYLTRGFSAFDLIKQLQKPQNDFLALTSISGGISAMIPKSDFSSSLIGVIRTQKSVADMLGTHSMSYLTKTSSISDLVKNMMPGYTSPITEMFSGLSKFNNEPYTNTIFQFNNSLKSVTGFIPKLNEISNFSRRIENIYSPLNSVISDLGIQKMGNELHGKFPKGLIDFSSHSILSSSFLNISSVLGNIRYENGYQQNDDLVIADSLNVALNIDLENATLANSEIPAIVIENELSKILAIINTGKTTINDIYARLKNYHSSIKDTNTYKVIMFILLTIFAHQVENVYDDFTKSDETTETTSIQHTFSKEKILKLKPDGRSKTVSIIPVGVPIIIHENTGDWIYISFIVNGEQKVGWTLNNNMEN